VFRRNPAGQSLMRKFREERRAEMRATWRSLVFGTGLLLVCAYFVVRGDGFVQTFSAFALGAGLTGLCFGWMLGFNARNLTWAWGAAGERWTADELGRLSSDWRVYHDIPDGRGNWDHIAVGPPCVFAIDSKSLSDPAFVDDQGLRAGRLRFDGNKTRSSAVRMKELIERHTGHAVWVQGVLAVWGQLPEDVIERDKVLYVSAPRLVATLENQPPRGPRLTDAQREDVNEALDQIRRDRA
jgi:Nuclease-related domain